MALAAESIVHFKSGNKISVPLNVAEILCDTIEKGDQTFLTVLDRDDNIMYGFKLDEIEVIGQETIIT
jgi:hypothetical protein